MPMTLNVGLSQKVGLPDYGSYGASCNVTFELDGALLQNDLDGFHRHVKNAFVACRQAVQDELARQHDTNGVAGNGAPNGQTNGSRNGNGYPANGGNGNGQSRPQRSNGRKATASQIRALHAIASRHSFDLNRELQNRFRLDHPEDLSISQASQLIDALKQASGTAGETR